MQKPWLQVWSTPSQTPVRGWLPSQTKVLPA